MTIPLSQLHRAVLILTGLVALVAAPAAAHASDRASLTWDQPVDVDLHVYDAEGDHAFYGDLTGIPNAHMSEDDLNGPGPESFTEDDNAGRTFTYAACYYAPGSDGGRSPVTVTLVVNDPDGGSRTVRQTLNAPGDGVVLATSPDGPSVTTFANCGGAPPSPPPDQDGDGVSDAQDGCPTTPGQTANGCPPVSKPACDIMGTPGDDVLTGTDGSETICGLGGNDKISGLGGDDRIDAGSGDDLVNGGAGNDVVFGGDGEDDLRGGDGNDDLDGGAGDDVLRGQAGSDRMAGGPGRDEASWFYERTPITASLVTGRATGSGRDALLGIEDLTGSLADDHFTGNGVANTLAGSAGDDSLQGGGGPDLLFAGAGDDALQGGRGGDLLVGGLGANRSDGGPGYDTCYQSDRRRHCEEPSSPPAHHTVGRARSRGSAAVTTSPVVPTAGQGPDRRGLAAYRTRSEDSDRHDFSAYRTRRLCYGRICGRFEHGFFENIVKSNTWSGWNRQPAIFDEGRSLSAWFGVRPYAICFWDTWQFWASPTVATTAPFDTNGFEGTFAFDTYPKVLGPSAFLTYGAPQQGRLWQCTFNGSAVRNPTTPSQRYRIVMLPAYQGAKVKFVTHTQWTAVFATRQQFRTWRPIFGFDPVFASYELK